MSRKAAVVSPSIDVTNPVYFSVKNAAKYLDCTISAIRHELVYSGAVPYIRLGNRIIFTRADLDDFIERKRAQAA
jgi:excisionase family DNA binding protein